MTRSDAITCECGEFEHIVVIRTSTWLEKQTKDLTFETHRREEKSLWWRLVTAYKLVRGKEPDYMDSMWTMENVNQVRAIFDAYEALDATEFGASSA